MPIPSIGGTWIPQAEDFSQEVTEEVPKKKGRNLIKEAAASVKDAVGAVLPRHPEKPFEEPVEVQKAQQAHADLLAAQDKSKTGPQTSEKGPTSAPAANPVVELEKPLEDSAEAKITKAGDVANYIDKEGRWIQTPITQAQYDKWQNT